MRSSARIVGTLAVVFVAVSGFDARAADPASVAQAQRDVKHITLHEVHKLGYALIEESRRAHCVRLSPRRFSCRLYFEMGDSYYRGQGRLRNRPDGELIYDFRVRGVCASETCGDSAGKVSTRWRWRGRSSRASG